MKLPLQTIIKDACESVGDVDFRDNYTGRGMIRTSCIGIVGSLSSCKAVVAYVIKELSMELRGGYQAAFTADDELALDAVAVAEHEFDKSIDVLMNWSEDSMGRGAVIMYWDALESI